MYNVGRKLENLFLAVGYAEANTMKFFRLSVNGDIGIASGKSTSLRQRRNTSSKQSTEMVKNNEMLSIQS